MRRLLLAAMMAGVAHGALAADLPELPVLRGFIGEAPHRTNWNGFYVGAQAARGTSDIDFTNATAALVHRLLFGTAIENEGQVSQFPVLSKVSIHGNGFGGFAGYNGQWDDAIVGVEASVVQGAFGGSSSGSVGRIFTTSNGYTNNVTNSGTASLHIKDFGSLRVRGGWAAYNFMPYLFGGVTLGLADISQSAHVFGTQTNINAQPGFQFVPFDLSGSSSLHGRWIYGYSAGAGIDVMLFGGLFARGEFEYMKFTGSTKAAVSTGRVGVGYKF